MAQMNNRFVRRHPLLPAWRLPLLVFVYTLQGNRTFATNPDDIKIWLFAIWLFALPFALASGVIEEMPKPWRRSPEAASGGA